MNSADSSGLDRQNPAVLLTLTTTAAPATDLGFLLHKHPDRLQTFDVPVGQVHVFYPQAEPDVCTAALLLEVDPVGLVRGRRSAGSGAQDYVNDRPYAASSLLAVALGRVFRTAMAGRCDARPELAAQPLPLRVHLPAVPSRGGAGLVARLFAPLGWEVAATPVPLDEQVPQWGSSRYVDLELTGTVRLADALRHLYVLLPVLDDSKHYWVSGDEVDKLLRAGEGWLTAHPERDLITRRYLAHDRRLVSAAVDRLAEVDDVEPEVQDLEPDVLAAAPVDVPPRRVSLAEQRKDAVLAVLREAGVRRVVDLGCGEGALLVRLLRDPSFSEVVGADVSDRALQLAARNLHLDRMPDSQRARLRLLQSSVTYRDNRLAGFDAVVLMEVVEHVDPARLGALERTVFGAARPRVVVMTTPNAEHNVRYADLPAGTMRHADHRFEWTRAQFRDWSQAVADAHGYDVRHLPVGEPDPDVGPPTQLAVFSCRTQVPA